MSILERVFSFGFFLFLLSVSFLMPRTSYGQPSEIEFIDFEMSDTVFIGGTLTVVGVLKNNGTMPIPAELALRMATGTTDNPPVPYGDDYFENNFNNAVIQPGELQPFVRLIEVTEAWFDLANSNLQQDGSTGTLKNAAPAGRIIAVIWPRGDNPQLERQENTAQYKSGFDDAVSYLDSIVVLRPDEKLTSDSYDSNPAILKGSNFQGTFLENLMPEDIVGFRYENDQWMQIPIQIDEMKWVDINTIYGEGAQSSVIDNTVVYADSNTYVGADSIITFDADDELVFMLKDAGNYTDLANGIPLGTLPGTGVEISIQNEKLQSDTYVYLFQQDGSLMQHADSNYVSYNFSLDADYFTSYNILFDNPENSTVITDNYTLNFSDTWITQDINIIEGESSGVDILETYDTYTATNPFVYTDLTLRAFVSNKTGPIRAIRSYIRGDIYDLVEMQKTHFFYTERYDIFTNLRGEPSDPYLFDIINMDVTEEYMNYRSNIDVTPFLMDNVSDSICVTLYNDTPLEWELIEGSQGSMGIIHEILTNDVPNNSDLLHGYWNEGGVNSYVETNGQDDIVMGQTNTGVGMWLNIGELYENSTSPNIEYRRYTYFDEPGMSVETINARSASIQQKPLVDVNTANTQYDINISVYLEGPFLTSDMNNSLNTIYELLPAQDTSLPIIMPYSIAPWNYIGTECDTFINKKYPENTIDWLLVSFRTGLTSETEVAKTMALLTQDGTIEFLNDDILTKEDGNSFYIVIEHRNHIGIITPTPIPVINNKLEYDFRTQNSFNANGTSYGQKQVAPDIWAMFAGECIQEVNGNDINGNDKAQWVIENGTFLIYSPTDFNMDGTVDGQDKAIWFNNNGISGALTR